MELQISQMVLPVGRNLNGHKYAIINKIGEGGFSITYRARQNDLNRMVCIKEYFLYGRCTRDIVSSKVLVQSADAELFEKYRQSFVHEAETVASLKHNNIVEVLNIFHENGTSYMVMPFIEGQSLESLVSKRGALPLDEAKNYMSQVAEAVGYIHERNILHRDIKPGNIMITGDAHAILIDFGSAREFVNDKTQAHTSLLTRGYAPPEQYSTVSRKGRYSDIYSLGATLYYVLTATPPVDAAARMTEPFPEPASLNPAIPARINNAIMKAMQTNPADRYQDVHSFVSDLWKTEKISGGTPQSTLPVKPDDERKQRKNKIWLWVLLAAVACFIVGIVALVRNVGPAPMKEKYINEREAEKLQAELEAAQKECTKDSIAYAKANNEKRKIVDDIVIYTDSLATAKGNDKKRIVETIKSANENMDKMKPTLEKLEQKFKVSQKKRDDILKAINDAKKTDSGQESQPKENPPSVPPKKTNKDETNNIISDNSKSDAKTVTINTLELNNDHGQLYVKITIKNDIVVEVEPVYSEKTTPETKAAVNELVDKGVFNRWKNLSIDKALKTHLSPDGKYDLTIIRLDGQISYGLKSYKKK